MTTVRIDIRLSQIRPIFLTLPACLSKWVVSLGAVLMAGCGGDHSVGISPYLTDATVAEAVKAGVVKIQASPKLTPEFDAAIHDYVVDCNAESEVKFSAQLSRPDFFGFFAPGDEGKVVSPLIAGTFNTSLSMHEGQRYRFRISLDPDEYSVRCLPKDFPPLSVSITGARKAAGYLFSPSLFFTASTADPISNRALYVIVVDANGTPIWWKSEPSGRPLDAKILNSHEIAWTVQTNDDDGTYVIRDFSGRILNVFGGVLDSHDFQPTGVGSYLAIRYLTRTCPPDCVDMSPWGGPVSTAVTDAQIFELDGESHILWTWNSRDHIALSETGNAGWYPGVGPDIIHMNAVEPDGSDAVIFSARHLNAIYRITKATGAIDWKIGGTPTPESLVVVNDSRPTAIGPNGQSLSGQHDVRKWSDGSVSVHDNGTIASRQPFIVRYEINAASRTATVVEEIPDLSDPSSFCCGSARRVPDGHWVAAWGGQSYMTELDSTGNPVITIKYGLGSQFSYRAVPLLSDSVSLNDLRLGMDSMM